MRLFWSRRAQGDLDAIHAFIARDSPEAAARWIGQGWARARKALAAPQAGRMVPELGRPGIREVLVKSYRIVYLVQADRIVVLTLFESHRLLGESPQP
jgi:toxin ParE1/3/4